MLLVLLVVHVGSYVFLLRFVSVHAGVRARPNTHTSIRRVLGTCLIGVVFEVTRWFWSFLLHLLLRVAVHLFFKLFHLVVDLNHNSHVIAGILKDIAAHTIVLWGMQRGYDVLRSY